MSDIDDAFDLIRIRYPNFTKDDVFKTFDCSYKIDKNAINNLVVLTYLFKLKYPEFIKKKSKKLQTH